MEHTPTRIKVITMRTIVCFILVCLLLGCSGSGNGSIGSFNTDNTATDPFDNEPSGIMTFDSVSGDICREDGEPVIRLFSTTWCPHCQWIGNTFDDVVKGSNLLLTLAPMIPIFLWFSGFHCNTGKQVKMLADKGTTWCTEKSKQRRMLTLSFQ